MKILVLILGFISEAWGLIFKVALVIIAIVVVVGFIQSCTANATLSEHSSCKQFAQADTTAMCGSKAVASLISCATTTG